MTVFSGVKAVERLRAAGRAALLALAVVLPFERLDPLARIGPLQLSSVELFVYLALATWGAALIAGWCAGDRDLAGRLERAPFAHRAVAAFGLVLFLSAVLAPASRGTAVKFALRSAGGILLYAAAADLLRAPQAVARMAKALVVGASVAALLVVAEQRSQQAGALLHPFHLRTFEAFGRPRASGPFQYPNIAAMYLEAVAPIVVALGAAAIAVRRSRGPVGGVVLVLLVLLAGVVATASRAGLVGALAAVVVLGALYGSERETRRLARVTLVTALVVVALASGSSLVGRFRFWRDGDWYRGVVMQAGGLEGRLPRVLPPSGEATESLDVANQGELAWLREARYPVTLSYHWLDGETGRVVVSDGRRTLLPRDIYRGESALVRALVRAPPRPGRYILWWDLVHEYTTWFSERGNPGLREPVVVGSDGGGLAPSLKSLVLPPSAAPDGTERRTLWSAALAAWRTRPLFGIGPDNFRHLSGQFLGRATTDERIHANNLYFETLADLGTIGLVALAVLVGALVGAARRAAAIPATRLLSFGVTAGLATYFLHGTLDYFLEFTPTYALFWLLAGMLVALERPWEAVA